MTLHVIQEISFLNYFALFSSLCMTVTFKHENMTLHLSDLVLSSKYFLGAGPGLLQIECEHQIRLFTKNHCDFYLSFSLLIFSEKSNHSLFLRKSNALPTP
jgi:hypothetical protein